MPARKEADDDPVTNEYDVYLTQNLIEKYFLLQFPTRDRERPFNEDYMTAPLAARIKPKTGFVELDVPMTTVVNHDKVKAAEWGSALAMNKQDTTEGYGLAVGFSQAARAQGGRRAHAASPDEDAHRPALERQTIGGQMIHDERGKPNYMIGTFLTDKRELHLTELDGVVQMRPQFHHIDAATQLVRTKPRPDKDTGEPPVSKAVQISYTSLDQEQNEGATTKALLHAAHEEPWKHLVFNDEEAEASYESFSNHLFLAQEQHQTELVSTMANEKYLDAISAPRLDHRGAPRTKPMTKKQKAQIDLSDNEASDADGPVRPGAQREMSFREPSQALP